MVQASAGATLDALVIGAGPVGLTMAAELLRHGLRCRVIDRSPAPTDKSKALVLWPRTLELLADADAVERFLAAGMPLRTAAIFGDGRRLASLSLDGVASPYPFALMLPQSETERLLDAHLDRLGGRVERGVELCAFDTRADVVTATLRHPDASEERVTCAWLIGCDGAHSTVRHGLGIEFAGAAEANDWILADVRVAGALPADELRIYWHHDGILAFFPITPQRFRVIADRGAAAPTEKPRDPTLIEVQGVVDTRGPGGLMLHDPVWLAAFRINERKVDDYQRGRAFLAGDAAHIHSPAGGQGMNTGMQDAYNLAWKLALVQRGRGRALLLESYSAERSAVGDIVLRNAGAMTSIATLRRPAAQHLRNAIAPFVTSLGFVQEKARETLSELAIHYRSSALSRDDRSRARRPRGGVVAGDRGPDAALVEAGAGSPTQLFTLLRGTRHALLLLAGAAADAAALAGLREIAAAVEAAHPDLFAIHLIVAAPPGAPAAVLIDRDGTLHSRYGAQAPTVVVIRPDGYVGYVGAPASAEKLLRHLESYLVPAAMA